MKYKLELMFMKHYAPNRCLYIKVAKLRTGGGGGEGVQRCHTYKIAVSKYQGRCEQRSEVFVKIQKKIFFFFFFFWGGGGSGRGGMFGGREGSGLGGQGGCDRRIEILGKFTKKKSGGGVGMAGFVLGGGGGVRVDVNEELKFL